MEVLASAVLAHLLYDVHWQGAFIAEYKGRSAFILFVHALTWALLVSAVLWCFGVFAVWKLVLLLVTHFVVDGWKARLPKAPEWFWAIYVDQAIHFATLIVVALRW